jgi:hypothetical protein
LIAFLLPFFSFSSSIGKLAEHFSYGGNDLLNAFAAGAMVLVARTREWRPDSHFSIMHMNTSPDFRNIDA